MGLLDKIKAGLTLRRAANQLERDKMGNYDWTKSLKAGLTQILTLVLTAVIAAVYGVLSDSEAIKKILIGAGVNEAYVGVILLVLAGALRVGQNWFKHSPNAPRPSKDDIAAMMIAFVLILPSPALAQDFNVFKYLTQHASVATGALIADGEAYKVVELRFVDDFRIADKWRGAARVGLFSLTRSGEQAPPPPTIPTTLDEIKAYSDGELWVSVRREIRQGIALECLGGFTFKMISITGSVGDPLDGTKLAGACGPRFSQGEYSISVLGGHYGPVADEGKLLGFVPNILIHGYLPMKFLGASTAFTPDLAFGAIPADAKDPDQRRTVSKSLRLLISTRF